MDGAALVELIARIPGAFWGTLTGFLLAIVPVLVTNRHNRKQQRQQLDFDSVERQRERQANLRRDVYLPAADAVTGMVNAMGQLLGDEVSPDQINEGARAFGAALTRILMVAQPETIKSVSEFQREFLRALSVLQQLRYPMMLRKADIQIAASTRQGYQDERTKCIELMKEYNVAGVRDERRFQAIQRQDAYAGEQWTKVHGEWLRLVLAQETARLEMAREYATRMEALMKLQPPLLAAIRGELETSDATALLAEEAEKTAIVGMRTLTDLIPMIERGVENLRRDVEADDQRRAARPSE